MVSGQQNGQARFRSERVYRLRSVLHALARKGQGWPTSAVSDKPAAFRRESASEAPEEAITEALGKADPRVSLMIHLATLGLAHR